MSSSQARSEQSSLNTMMTERQKAKWKPDQLASNCDRCDAEFGVFRRKHHCRRCGGIYCDTCCSARVLLPGYGSEAQRVCKVCDAILAQQHQAQPSSSSVVAGGGAGGSTSSSPAGHQKAGGSTSPRTGSGKQGSGGTSQQSAASNNNMGNAASAGGGVGSPLPSLECFPRERRVLLIGSPGVGKGSFITSAIGASPQQAPSASNVNINNNSSSQQDQYHYSSSPYSSGAAGGGGSASQQQQQQGGSSSNTNNNNTTAADNNTAAFSEKRRLINYQGQAYQLILVNTAGSTVSSELFVHPLLTIGTSAYILMYDVTEPKSFEVLPLLHERLLDCGAHDKPMILVGSKADHVSQGGAGRERIVSKDAAHRVAAQWKIPHVDVSSTSRDSVDFALMELLKEIAARDIY